MNSVTLLRIYLRNDRQKGCLKGSTETGRDVVQLWMPCSSQIPACQELRLSQDYCLNKDDHEFILSVTQFKSRQPQLEDAYKSVPTATKSAFTRWHTTCISPSTFAPYFACVLHIRSDLWLVFGCHQIWEIKLIGDEGTLLFVRFCFLFWTTRFIQRRNGATLPRSCPLPNLSSAHIYKFHVILDVPLRRLDSISCQICKAIILHGVQQFHWAHFLGAIVALWRKLAV